MKYIEYQDNQEKRTQRRGFCLVIDEKTAKDIDQDWNYVDCKVILIDRATGLEHESKISSPVEFQESLEYDIETDGFPSYWSVHDYFLFWHYCGCHRLSGMKNEPETQVDCPSNRFIVKSVIHPRYPDLNLYFEEPVGTYVGENE